MYPQLFKRTATGKVQVWEIEVGGDRYRTISGQLEGKLTTSEWTVCTPKNVGRSNETSAAEQAWSEATSAWTKKVESGYRETVGQIDDIGFIKPMLAQDYADRSGELLFPLYSQPKLDGMRCIVTREGMQSRKGKPIISAPHIAENLRAAFEEFPHILAFDGELYAEHYADDFNAIMSLARKTKPTKEDLKRSRNELEYWIYDVILGDDSSFQERYFGSLRTAVDYIYEEDPDLMVVDVPTVIVHTQDRLDELFESYLEQGFEGQIIRDPRAAYEHKRSKALLKRKNMQDAEYEIVDVVEGLGNKSRMAGSVTLRLDDGRTFSSNVTGGNDYARDLLSRRSEVIGKQGTVQFFHLTPDGVPRFPQFKGVRDYE
jgi:DNA ligase 1